ncbi:DUF2851 family protein [Gramella lutea]|uniref:DUF2851 family protein n=1 Tax=Christiangramia lutea TaxID=1607951 RepID=A0A9X2ABU8_9FLAO|nr:DUF2851 family protein [Christiangramia lutea]
MREDFLYHIWKFRKFRTEALETTDGDYIDIVHPGVQNELAGPDFFNAKIQVGDQLWAGNVEMHIKSSDWYFHNHETDPNYDNVIVHVVWVHDVEVYRMDGSTIPTIELKGKVDAELLEAYFSLLEKKHIQINCENDFKDFSEFQLQHWLERLYFERLEAKSEKILQILSGTGNNWEWVLFIMLSRGFGLNVNAESFTQLASNIDFRIVQKLFRKQLSLEALLLGQAGLMQETDNYGKNLSEEYNFLRNKFSLNDNYSEKPQFFRLRPDNFPTIRLAQLAALYAEKNNFFQSIIQCDNIIDLRTLFQVNVSEYWKTHYNFGKKHKTRTKNLSNNFIDLILINCVIPLRHCYAKYIGKDEVQLIQDFISAVKPEKNSVIKIFDDLRPGTASNALQSQALLQLKNEYCNLNNCLQCELGASLLKKSPKYI